MRIRAIMGDVSYVWQLRGRMRRWGFVPGQFHYSRRYISNHCNG